MIVVLNCIGLQNILNLAIMDQFLGKTIKSVELKKDSNNVNLQCVEIKFEDGGGVRVLVDREKVQDFIEVQDMG